MAMPRVSPSLPHYDPTKASLAYGDRALPKLVRGIAFAEHIISWSYFLALEYRITKCRFKSAPTGSITAG